MYFRIYKNIKDILNCFRISINELRISIHELWISLNKLWISKNRELIVKRHPIPIHTPVLLYIKVVFEGGRHFTDMFSWGQVY